MTVHCVSYDLNKQGKNYSALHAELKRTGHLHVLDSTWLIATNESAAELATRCLQHIDSDDRLLVIKVVRQYSGWLSEEAWRWIDTHVTDPA